MSKTLSLLLRGRFHRSRVQLAPARERLLRQIRARRAGGLGNGLGLAHGAGHHKLLFSHSQAAARLTRQTPVKAALAPKAQCHQCCNHMTRRRPDNDLNAALLSWRSATPLRARNGARAHHFFEALCAAGERSVGNPAWGGAEDVKGGAEDVVFKCKAPGRKFNARGIVGTTKT